MHSTTIALLFMLFALNTFGQSRSMFSREEVLKDLAILRESLEDAHYNIYAYSSWEEIDSAFTTVKHSIQKDSLSLLEATNALQSFVSVIKNGHTEIDFPIGSYLAYANSGGTLFPIEIAFENGKSLVRKNFAGDTSIEVGSEILSINGLTMSEVLSRIYPQVSAERSYLKNAKIELFSFPRYYWRVFGEQDSFEVEIRSEGQITSHVIEALNLIEGYEKKRDEILNAQMELSLFEQASYLNPGSFSGDLEAFKRFVDSAFAVINNRADDNLIIDLRNNGGGDDAFSDYLVSYIANQPFKWNSSFTLKTSQFLKEHVRQNYDTTDVYWQSVLNHENGEIYPYEFPEYQPQPVKSRFNGEVFVLVNRQSHSQAAVTAAQIQDHGFGTIVGEETAEYPTLYASQFQYNLPNTGIPVKVSKGHIVRVNGSTVERGVIPDVVIKDHLLDENDEILTGVLKMISE